MHTKNDQNELKLCMRCSICHLKVSWKFEQNRRWWGFFGFPLVWNDPFLILGRSTRSYGSARSSETILTNKQKRTQTLFVIRILRRWSLHFCEKQSRVHLSGPHCSRKKSFQTFSTFTSIHKYWVVALVTETIFYLYMKS